MIKLIITGRLAADKSAADAFAHMRDVHGPLVYDPPADAGAMPSRYAQNHAFEDDLGDWRSDRQFVTEIGFDDIAHLKAATSTRYYLETLRPDERNFVDPTSVRALVTRPGARRESGRDLVARLFVFVKGLDVESSAELLASCDETLMTWLGEADLPPWTIDNALPPPGPQPVLADRVVSLGFADRDQARAFARAHLPGLAERLVGLADARAGFAVLADAYSTDRLRRTRNGT